MLDHKTSCLTRSWCFRCLFLFLIILLGGCISTAEEDIENPVTGTQPGDITLSGSVGDGPITGATVTITDATGSVIRTAASDAEANYNVTLPSGSSYPLLLTATGGTDLVTQGPPDFVMVAAAMDNSTRTANINPFTTLIVRTAQSMSGGLTAQNIESASASVLSELNFGFDTALSPNPLSTPVTGTNAANIIKSSEALGEMIRRTRNALLVPGIAYSEDQIISLLASDLSTGSLNGNGPGTDARVTATAKIVSAQVLVESVRNELAVDGADATERMNNAITATFPGALTSTSGVVITAAMIEQLRDMIDAAASMTPSQELDELAAAALQLTPGSLPSEVTTIIPADASGRFSDAIAEVVTATEEEMQEVNDDDDGPADGENPLGLSISATSPSSYQWDMLNNGGTVYIDRNFTYTTIPAVIEGYNVLRTANDDKAATGSSFIEFTVNETAAVYVARDVRLIALPTWMNNWDDTGLTLVTTDATLNLYRREFPQGTVVLGGNQGNTTSSMYIVLAAALDEDPADGAPPDDDPPPPDDGNDDGSGGDTDTTAPTAANDVVTTAMNSQISIEILANDDGLDDAPITVSVISSPASGQAQVTQDNRITYTPDQDFSGTDSFNYRVQDTDGDFSTASVTVEVTCGQCAAGVSIVYSWDPSPGPVSGYRVFTGGTIASAAQLVSNLPAGLPGFNSQAPTISYDAWNDLQLEIGDSLCFRVRAYNSAGESAFSEGICGVIPQ